MKHRLETLVNRIRHSLGGEDVVSKGAGLQQETSCDSYVYGTVNQACISIIQKKWQRKRKSVLEIWFFWMKLHWKELWIIYELGKIIF